MDGILLESGPIAHPWRDLVAVQKAQNHFCNPLWRTWTKKTLINETAPFPFSIFLSQKYGFKGVFNGYCPHFSIFNKSNPF